MYIVYGKYYFSLFSGLKYVRQIFSQNAGWSVWNLRAFCWVNVNRTCVEYDVKYLCTYHVVAKKTRHLFNFKVYMKKLFWKSYREENPFACLFRCWNRNSMLNQCSFEHCPELSRYPGHLRIVDMRHNRTQTKEDCTQTSIWNKNDYNEIDKLFRFHALSMKH